MSLFHISSRYHHLIKNINRNPTFFFTGTIFLNRFTNIISDSIKEEQLHLKWNAVFTKWNILHHKLVAKIKFFQNKQVEYFLFGMQWRICHPFISYIKFILQQKTYLNSVCTVVTELFIVQGWKRSRWSISA